LDRSLLSIVSRNFNEKIVKKTVKLMDFVHDDEFFIQR